MSHLVLILSTCVVGMVAFLLLWRYTGVFSALLGSMLVSLAVVPRVLWGTQQADLTRTAIAGTQVRILTFTVAVMLICIFAIFLRRRGVLTATYLPFLLLLAAWSLFVWDGSSQSWAGTVHLAIAALAWVAGSYLSTFDRGEAKQAWTILVWIGAITLGQTIVSVLQWFGIPLFSLSDFTAGDLALAGRAHGTLAHPTALGKVVLFFFMLILPLTESTTGKIRLYSWVVVALGFVPLALSGGRANFVAALLMLVIWVFLTPSSRKFARMFSDRWYLNLKLLVPAGLLVVVAATTPLWINRFATGEDGTHRTHFVEVALQQLSWRPWWKGTGPGSYVSEIGKYDELTSQGWPVHNTPLFAAVELGFIVALALFIPMVIWAINAWTVRNEQTPGAGYARVYIASIPGIAIVALTGWGMMAEHLVFWLFVLGYCATQIGQVRVASGRTVSIIPLSQIPLLRRMSSRITQKND